METETSKDFVNQRIETTGLNEKFKVQASSEEDANVTVTVKGVNSILSKLDEKDNGIKAYVDLSNITEPGTYTVPVYVSGNDVRLTYTSKTKTVQVIITEQ